MKIKFGLVLLFALLVFVAGFSHVYAQEATPTPTPTPTPTLTPTPTSVPCASTQDGTPGNWVYAIGGASRSRTIPIVDSNTGGDCGSRVETQYPYCVSNVDGNYTDWFLQDQQPEGATPGQCGGGLSTITICYQGQTREVLHNGEELSSYPGYTEGACPTPTPPPPPSNPGGPGDGRSDGRSDGLSSCPSCTAPPKGQVLGASTSVLAATGTNDELAKIIAGVSTALAVFLLGNVLLSRKKEFSH